MTTQESNQVKVELLGQEISTTAIPETMLASNRFHIKMGDACNLKQTADIFHEESVRRVLEPTLVANKQYQYPFRIYAPSNVAPSMKYKESSASGDKNEESTSGCSIEYRLTASFLSSHVTKSIDMVGQPLSAKLHPVTVEPSVVPVVTQNFSWKHMVAGSKHRARKGQDQTELHHHGCLIWAARVKNTHVGKGQDVKLSFALRNASSYDVIKMACKLVEKVAWKTHSGEPRLQTNELEYAIMTNEAFFKHQRATLSRHQSQIVLLDHATDEEMHEELGLLDNTLTIPIPPKCRDSYKGKLIQVSHHLIIEVRTGDTHGKDHKASMTLELPLKVFDPPIADHHSLHHNHSHGKSNKLEFRSPKEMAEIVMTKWPSDDDVPVVPAGHLDESANMQASFTSIEDTSWAELSEHALLVPEIKETPPPKATPREA